MNEIKLIQGACSNTKTGEMECIKTHKTTSDTNRKRVCRAGDMTSRATQEQTSECRN